MMLLGAFLSIKVNRSLCIYEMISFCALNKTVNHTGLKQYECE